MANLEPQVCISCNREFLSEVVEAIPVCPECKIEEQETALTPDATTSALENTQTHITADAPPIVEQNKPAGWRIKKSDGKIFGPFSANQIMSWAKQNKILPAEQIAKEGDDTSWQRIGDSPTFGHLFPDEDILPEEDISSQEAISDDDPINQMTERASTIGGTLKQVSQKPLFPAGNLSSSYETPKLTPESVELFSKPSKLKKVDWQKYLLPSGIGLAILLVVVLIWQIHWAAVWQDASRWWHTRNRVNDRVDEYIAAYQKEIGDVDGEADDHFRKGITFYEKQTPRSISQSEFQFKKALTIDPDHVGAMASLAELITERAYIRSDTDLFKVAYDLAFKSLKLNPKNNLAKRAVALLLIRVNSRHDEAKGHLDQLLERNPLDAWVLSLMGQWYLHFPPDNEEANNQAIEYLQKSLATNPDLASSQYYLGQAYLRNHAYAQASKSFAKIFRLAGGEISLGEELSVYAARSRLALGDIQFLIANYTSALQDYQEAIEIDPQYVQAYMKMGNLFLFYLRKPDQAELIFKKLLSPTNARRTAFAS